MMCRIDDAEPWTVYSDTTPVARKPHCCLDCGRTIAVGEMYHRLSGLCDGHWSTLRRCRHCEAAGAWLIIECGGRMIGELADELGEHWREDVSYRSTWLARAIAGVRHQWHDGRMDVPVAPPRMAVAS